MNNTGNRNISRKLYAQLMFNYFYGRWWKRDGVGPPNPVQPPRKRLSVMYRIIGTGKEGKLLNDSIIFMADGGDGVGPKLEEPSMGSVPPYSNERCVDAYVTHCMTLFPATGGEKLYISRLVYINKNSAKSYFVEFLPSYYLKDLFPAVVPQINVQVAPELDRWRIPPEISVVSST